MRNPLFILIALVLFIVVVFSASFSSKTNVPQVPNSTNYPQPSAIVETSNPSSLKGFTLGAALPTFDRYNYGEEYYQDEKHVSVSGVDGNLTAIFHLESVGYEDYDKIFESRSDLEELTVDEFDAKWGVPIITTIEFSPDHAVLCRGRYEHGRFIHQEEKSQFVQNVSDFYSVKLKFDKNEGPWTGVNNNLRIELNVGLLSLIDVSHEAETKRELTEYKRKKAQQHAKDF